MEYYSWAAKDKPVQVRLSLPMLQFMVRWLHDREARQPEMFGMLLGRFRRGWKRTTVFVDDFEAFDPATLRGSPKPPHGTDLKVVGLYRRRPGELTLDQLDASLIQTSFVHPAMVYLLIEPESSGPDRAAFFIQEHGEVHGYGNYGEFSLDAESLRGTAAPGSPANRRWLPWAGLGASLLALAGWFFWLRERPAAKPVEVAPRPAAVTPAAVAPAAKSVAAPPVRKPKPTAQRKRPAKSRKRRR